MNRVYPSLFLALLLLEGCSKQQDPAPGAQLQGTWKLNAYKQEVFELPDQLLPIRLDHALGISDTPAEFTPSEWRVTDFRLPRAPAPVAYPYTRSGLTISTTFGSLNGLPRQWVIAELSDTTLVVRMVDTLRASVYRVTSYHYKK